MRRRFRLSPKWAFLDEKVGLVAYLCAHGTVSVDGSNGRFPVGEIVAVDGEVVAVETTEEYEQRQHDEVGSPPRRRGRQDLDAMNERRLLVTPATVQFRRDRLGPPDMGRPVYALDSETVSAQGGPSAVPVGRLLALSSNGTATVALGGVAAAPVAADQHIRAGAMVLRDSSGNVTVSASPTTTAQQVVDAVNAATNTPPDAPRLHAAPRSWSLASSALGRAAEAASATFSGLAGAMGSMQRAAVEAMRVREESMVREVFRRDQSTEPHFDTFTTLSYSDSVDSAVVRGVSPIQLGITRGQYAASGSITVSREFFEALTVEPTASAPTPTPTPTPPLTCEAVEIAPSAPQRLLTSLLPWLNEEVDLGDEALWQLNSDAAVTQHAVVYVPERKALRVASRQELHHADAAAWRQVDWKRGQLPP